MFPLTGRLVDLVPQLLGSWYIFHTRATKAGKLSKMKDKCIKFIIKLQQGSVEQGGESDSATGLRHGIRNGRDGQNCDPLQITVLFLKTGKRSTVCCNQNA